MMKPVLLMVFLGLSGLCQAAKLVPEETSFLSAEAAFPLSVVREKSLVRLRWTLPDGYYLYRDKVSVRTNGKPLRLLLNQKPEFRPEFETGFQYLLKGRVEVVFYDIPDNAILDIRYQGCSAAGLCYPPQHVEVPSGRL